MSEESPPEHQSVTQPPTAEIKSAPVISRRGFLRVLSGTLLGFVLAKPPKAEAAPVQPATPGNKAIPEGTVIGPDDILPEDHPQFCPPETAGGNNFIIMDKDGCLPLDTVPSQPKDPDDHTEEIFERTMGRSKSPKP